METNWRYHLPAEKRREKPSADSNPVREKSLARSTSIMNKRRTWRQTRERKKWLALEYILFTPLEELYSNGMCEDGTDRIHHLKARTNCIASRTGLPYGMEHTKQLRRTMVADSKGIHTSNQVETQLTRASTNVHAIKQSWAKLILDSRHRQRQLYFWNQNVYYF